MSSAQLDTHHHEAPGFDELEAAPAPFALKQQAAERIAAHRARRHKNQANPATAITVAPSPARARAARIAATVAERYANSPSYRTVLAAEAQRSIHEAEAAADIAVLNAQAVAEAQYTLLDELDQISPTTPELPAAGIAPPSSATHRAEPSSDQQPVIRTASRTPSAGVTVRLIEDLVPHTLDLAQSFTNAIVDSLPNTLDEERRALDEEIAFRQSPVFEESAPPQELPANLIEFPRQLVAARRARPRLAEGPLREDAESTPNTAQLRIFEVEPTQISTAHVDESSVTEWSSILLDAQPLASDGTAAYAPDYAPLYTSDTLADQLAQHHIPQPASVNLRLMACAVDACLILTAFIACTAAFALAAGPVLVSKPTLPLDALVAATSFILLAALYQLLFFSFSDATPGMRYARIALCTFNEDNPSRSAMRRRVFALLVSACPLGIGVLWAWLDPDHLGWHDRISRMYQRSY